MKLQANQGRKLNWYICSTEVIFFESAKLQHMASADTTAEATTPVILIEPKKAKMCCINVL